MGCVNTPPDQKVNNKISKVLYYAKFCSIQQTFQFLQYVSHCNPFTEKVILSRKKPFIKEAAVWCLWWRLRSQLGNDNYLQNCLLKLRHHFIFILSFIKQMNSQFTTLSKRFNLLQSELKPVWTICLTKCCYSSSSKTQVHKTCARNLILSFHRSSWLYCLEIPRNDPTRSMTLRAECTDTSPSFMVPEQREKHLKSCSCKRNSGSESGRRWRYLT